MYHFFSEHEHIHDTYIDIVGVMNKIGRAHV